MKKTKKPGAQRRVVSISIMAPVQVEMVVERANEEDTWTPIEIVRSDYRHTMTPTFVRENADEDLWDEIELRASAAPETK